MSMEVLLIFTITEIVALVIALALFVVEITDRLRAIANALGQVSQGVLRRIQGDVFLVGAGAALLNRKLNAIANVLPAIAEKAESLPSQQAQAAPTSGTDWRPSVTEDPMIRRR
jgi:uncharacterized protein YoxC